jgi:hypothetical protein
MSHSGESSGRPGARPLPHAWDAEVWDRAIAAEQLVCLREWEEVHGVEGRAVERIALTPALWDAIASIPFAQLGRVRFEERLRAVVRSARTALERALKEGADPAPPGVALDFAAALPSRAESRRHRQLRLHLEIGADALLRVTLGLPHELERHPAEGLFAEPS